MQPVPSPRGLDALRHAIAFAKVDPEFGPKFARAYGDVARLRVGPLSLYQLTRPEHFEHVLVKRLANYPKGSLLEKLSMVTGDGLITAEGETWRSHRRLVNPAFRPASLAVLSAAMIEAAEAGRARLLAKLDQEVDLFEELTHIALDTLVRTLFGASIQRSISEIHAAVTTAMFEVTRRMGNPFVLPPSWPTPANRRFAAAMKLLHEELDRIITARRASETEHEDLLGQMMRATDEEGQGARLSPSELRNECMTLFVAGHDTVAAAMAWACYLLTQEHACAAELHAEACRLLPEGGALQPEQIGELDYARQVASEALRLYPQPAVLFRQAVEDDVIEGFGIPSGAHVLLNTMTLHRRPELWPDPQRFVPERFSKRAVQERGRFAYLPFGAGARKCVGERFALLEASIVLTTLARDLRFEWTRARAPGMHVAATLQPKGGLPVRVRRA